MRSLTSSPAALRVSCTARMTSRARPSASSSGVVAVSSSTKPPPGSSASADVGLAVGLRRLEHELVLALDQLDAAGGDDAVDLRPVAGPRGLDDLLHAPCRGAGRRRAR